MAEVIVGHGVCRECKEPCDIVREKAEFEGGHPLNRGNYSKYEYSSNCCGAGVDADGDVDDRERGD